MGGSQRSGSTGSKKQPLVVSAGWAAGGSVGWHPARTEFPLIADYLPLVEQAVTKGTRRVYSPYWATVVREWGHRHVNEPTALEISQLAERSGQAPCSAGMPAEDAAPPST